MKKRLFFICASALSVHIAFAAQTCPVVDVKPVKIDAETDQISTADGALTVKIHGVATDDAHHVSRGGPVDVLDRNNKKICAAEIELLEPPFAVAGNRYFYYASGDAVDISLNVLDMNNCKVVWSSAKYPWLKRPKIEKNTVLLAGKKYAVNDQCLPDKKSVPIK